MIAKDEYNENIHNTLSSQYHSEIKVLTSTYTTFNIGLRPNFKRALFKIFAAPLCK